MTLLTLIGTLAIFCSELLLARRPSTMRISIVPPWRLHTAGASRMRILCISCASLVSIFFRTPTLPIAMALRPTTWDVVNTTEDGHLARSGGSVTFTIGQMRLSRLSAFLDSVATTITDRYGLVLISMLGTIDGNTVNDAFGQITICTQSCWQWLLLAAWMAVLIILYLMLTVASTPPTANRPSVWRSSIFPFCISKTRQNRKCHAATPWMI